METVKLAKMNLAINGLRGEIKQGDSYAEDLYDSFGKFDFVMANPPFNIKEVKTTRHGKPLTNRKISACCLTNQTNTATP